MRRHYGLQLGNVRTLEHALAYPALTSGQVDVIDVFSRDGQLDRFALLVLQDERRFFGDYSAVLLARQDFVARFPRSWARLQTGLVGKLNSPTMSRLNALADVDRRSFADVAGSFLGTTAGVTERATILGIAKVPALVALSLYALLPIVRNTYTGLIGVDRGLMEVADVLGLDRWQRLTRIELLLASLSITAGIKTSAVATVGTATLAAFIGGGGYGTLIVRGWR